MTAPALAIRLCPIGHALVNGECVTCRKRAAIARLRDVKRDTERAQHEARRAHRVELRRLRTVTKRIDADPEHSVCGIHRDTGAVCERCVEHRVWLERDLAATKPHYITMQEREARKASNEGWMTNYLHRPWGERHPEDRR